MPHTLATSPFPGFHGRRLDIARRERSPRDGPTPTLQRRYGRQHDQQRLTSLDTGPPSHEGPNAQRIPSTATAALKNSSTMPSMRVALRSTEEQRQQPREGGSCKHAPHPLPFDDGNDPAEQSPFTPPPIQEIGKSHDPPDREHRDGR